MALTTADEVKEIMIGCTLTTNQIDPFILAANTYLTEVFKEDTTLSTTLRKEIERWFTAHLIVSTSSGNSIGYQQAVKREKLGDAEVEYAVSASKAESGLSSTAFGRMALQLDTSGLLMAAGKQKASIFAVPSFE